MLVTVEKNLLDPLTSWLAITTDEDKAECEHESYSILFCRTYLLRKPLPR